jgi:hypothetical protein
MSKRSDFTRELGALLMYMGSEGDTPVIDFVKRSPEEQKRLFDAGLSKCDGTKVISKHQLGLAADLYLIDNEGKFMDWSKIVDKALKYHAFWDVCGGRMQIEWDRGHFEF